MPAAFETRFSSIAMARRYLRLGAAAMDDLSLAPEAHFESPRLKEPRTRDRLYSLNEADLFLVCDGHGDVRGGADGLFLRPHARAVAWMQRLDGGTPALLSTAVS